jgi:putative membrane protein
MATNEDKRLESNLEQRIEEHMDYRFSLANERTLLAWLRTALAIVAGGVLVARYIPEAGIPYGPLALGLLLVAFGALLSLLGARSFALNESAMRAGRPLPRSPLTRLLAWGITVAAVLAGLLLILAADDLHF